MRVTATCCFFSSRRRHTRWTGHWSSDVCSSDLAYRDAQQAAAAANAGRGRGRGGVDRVNFDNGVHADQDYAITWAKMYGNRRVFYASLRSEERRVGKEWRARGAPDQDRKQVVVA